MGYDGRTVISGGVSSGFNDTLSTSTGDTATTIDKDFPSPLPRHEPPGLPRPFSLVKSKVVEPKGLDRSLLNRANNIIDSLDHRDVVESTVHLESLRGIVLQLWEIAATSSQAHQEILAVLESAILSIESPNEGQLSAFKEAVMDLGNDVLTQAHVDVIRRRFIGEGFSPLALLSELKDGNYCD